MEHIETIKQKMSLSIITIVISPMFSAYCIHIKLPLNLKDNHFIDLRNKSLVLVINTYHDSLSSILLD